MMERKGGRGRGAEGSGGGGGSSRRRRYLELPHARFIGTRHVDGELLLAGAVYVLDLFFQALREIAL